MKFIAERKVKNSIVFLSIISIAASAAIFISGVVSRAEDSQWSEFDDTQKAGTPEPWEEVETPTPTKPSSAATPIPESPTKAKSNQTNEPAAKSTVRRSRKYVAPALHLLQSIDVDNQQNLASRTRLGISLSAALAKHVDANFAGEFEYHGQWSDTSSFLYENRLQTASVTLAYQPWFVTAGQQVVQWSHALALGPFRDFTPLDMRYSAHMFDGVSWQALGVFGITSGYKSQKITVEAVYLPFVTPNRYSLFNTDWSIIGNSPLDISFDLKQIVNFGSVQNITTFNDFLSLPNAMANHYLPATEKPEDDFNNASAGGRVSTTFESFRVGLAYLNGWDRFPTAYLSPELLTVLADHMIEPSETTQFIDGLQKSILKYERSQMVGFDCAYLSDAFTVGLEMAGFDQRTVYSDLFQVSRQKLLESALSASSKPAPELQLDGALYVSYLPNPPVGAWRKEVESSVSMKFSYFLSQYFYPFFGALVDFRSGTGLFDLGFSGNFIDQIKGSLGVHLYRGGDSYLFELRPMSNEVYAIVKFEF